MIAALIPAAGQSRRMGRPKLLLALDGRPLIGRVVAALRDGGAERVLVVAPPASAEGAVEIAAAARRAGAEVLVLEQSTPEMRATIEQGLVHLEQGGPPGWLALTPGDLPGLSASIVARTLEIARARPDRLVAPSEVGTGRSGHPLVLPWAVARRIPELPRGVGVNMLVKSMVDQMVHVPIEDSRAFEDWDTPDDLLRWSSRAAVDTLLGKDKTP